MNIINKLSSFFWYKKKETSEKNESAEMNPYIQSRLLYNDLYGNAQQRYLNSRRLNFVLIGAIILALIGLIFLGLKSKIIPYVVGVEDGQVIYGKLATASNVERHRSGLTLYFLKKFITSSRSVSVDSENQINLERTAFAFTQGASTEHIKHYFNTNNPFLIAKEQTVSIQFNYINHVSTDSFDAQWTEIIRDSTDGHLLDKKKFTGNFVTNWDQPAQNSTILKYNPFGFYINHFSWTQVS